MFDYSILQKSVKNFSFKFFRHKSSFSKRFVFNNFTLNAVDFLTCRYEKVLIKQILPKSKLQSHFYHSSFTSIWSRSRCRTGPKLNTFPMSCIIRDSIILRLDTNSLQKTFYYRATISFTTTSLLPKAPYPFHVWFWSSKRGNMIVKLELRDGR